MKYTKEEIKSAYEVIKQYRRCNIAASVNSVSRSGMSRRIELYAIKDNDIYRIGYYVSRIVGYPYDVDKGGIRADGCGMDMRFSIVSNLNYALWEHDVEARFPGLNPWLVEAKTAMGKEPGYRIYDDYFFDANRIRSL